MISTIALIAGCGSSAHAEVTGLVVDARTGLAIPGARVVAQDGSATRTDAEGRFTLTLSSGDAREIRASAAGRVDGRTRVDVRVDENASIVIELVACAPRAGDVAGACGREVAWDEHGPHDPDAVLRWIDDLDLERWLVRGVREPEDEVLDDDTLDTTAARGSDGPADDATQAWGAREQWALGSMTLDGSGLRSSAGVGSSGARSSPDEARAECATCHDGGTFAALHATAIAASDASPHAAPSADRSFRSVSEPECAACHDDRVATGARLRVYESAGPVAGESARGLGSGAICVECHRAVEQAGAHAPQADVVLGRGGRTLAHLDVGAAPHGAIADTCVACHAAPWRPADVEALTLGHTFEVREADGGIARDACSACHGDVRPESIARGDWDGDGVRGALGEEHDRALARARRAVEARVRRAGITARCGTAALSSRSRSGEARRSASGFREHEGAIVLVDVHRVMLGDCDGDDIIDPGERAVTVDALPRAVQDAAWDVMLLERDGSRGVHNPAFAFALLGAIESRL